MRLAVDGGHAFLAVSLAGGGREVIQAVELIVAEHDAVGGSVLLDAGDAPGTGDRRDVVALGEQPGQRDLRRVRMASAATVWTSATMPRLCWKFLPMKRGLSLRQSSSGMSSTVRICPVRKP